MRKRLPELRAIFQVYAVIAVMFAGWTMTAFLWKLSAWLLLLNQGEIFTIFSYAMTANFIESIIILLLIIAAGALLPAQALRHDFVVRGTILSIGLIGALMAFVGFHMWFGIETGARLWIAPIVVLLFTGIVVHQFADRKAVRSTAAWLSDRFLVFLFLLLPLFVLSFVYVIFRNIA